MDLPQYPTSTRQSIASAVADTGDASESCDLDGDGAASFYCEGTDCNDKDATVHPLADEIAGDGIDQDCDGHDAIVPVAWVESAGPGCSALPGSAGQASGLLLCLLVGIGLGRGRW